jgi:hypothetical protein
MIPFVLQHTSSIMNEIHCDQDLTIQNKYLATNIVDELYIFMWPKKVFGHHLGSSRASENASMIRTKSETRVWQ